MEQDDKRQRRVPPSRSMKPDPLKAERVQLLRRLPSGWTVDDRNDLVKVFTCGDTAAARFFTESARSSTASLQVPPEIRRQGAAVHIRILGSRGGPGEMECTIARIIEDRWMGD